MQKVYNGPTREEELQMWKDRQEAEHENNRALLVSTVNAERRRLIGLVLTHFARARRNGHHELAIYLDGLATEMENS